MNTTLLKKRAQMKRGPLDRCHGGEGALDFTVVLGGDDTKGRRLRFVHDDILKPGVSIGVHKHEHDEEYYLVLAGRGVMTLDGVAHEVGPGDITGVYPGGTHGLLNTGAEDLRVIVFAVA
jgi:mannose-6-phosphate isomerase-like protein (cupin superfamily)